MMPDFDLIGVLLTRCGMLMKDTAPVAILRAEPAEVATRILADPQSSNCPCIILDLALEDFDGVNLLRQMRATGWRGNAIILDDLLPRGTVLHEVERHGDRLL